MKKKNCIKILQKMTFVIMLFIGIAGASVSAADGDNYVTVDIKREWPSNEIKECSIYANGNPIMIDKIGEHTAIYKDNNGEKGEELILKGLAKEADGGYDLSKASIFGSCYEGDSGPIHITMLGGNVMYIFSGGGYKNADNGNVTGDTCVIISGDSKVYSVFAGGRYGNVTGNSYVYISDTSDVCFVYGGGLNGNVSGSTNVNISGGIIEYVYGAGSTQDSEVGSTKVIITGGTVGKVHGGGSYGSVVGDTEVDISGDARIEDSVYGGSYYSNNGSIKVNGNTAVNVRGNAAIGYGVFGGGEYSSVKGTANVVISENALIGASTSSVSIDIRGGVFGGCWGQYSSVKSANVTINGGKMKNVFGGGYQGKVEDSNVIINGGNIALCVYGGCWQKGFVGSTSVTVNEGAAVMNVFGGGYTGFYEKVETTNVIINGGTIYNVFGVNSRGKGEAESTIKIKGNPSVIGLVALDTGEMITLIGEITGNPIKIRPKVNDNGTVLIVPAIGQEQYLNAGKFSLCNLPGKEIVRDGDKLVIATARKTVTVNITPPVNLNYDSKGMEAQVSITGDSLVKDIDYTILYTGTGGYCSTTPPADAGAYTAVFQLTDIGSVKYMINNSSVTTVSFAVNPRIASIVWKGNTTRDYDGSPSNVTAAITNLTVGDNCDVTITGGKEVNAGSYTATAVSLSNPNYQLPADNSVEYEIRRIAPTVTFPYASAIEGTVIYGQPLSSFELVDGEGDGVFTWSDNTIIPTVSNSGYEVIFIPNSSNYYSVTKIINVAVQRAENRIAVICKDVAYGEKINAHLSINPYEDAAVIYEYKDKDSKDSAYTSIKPRNAGYYTVRVTAGQTANYNSVSAAENFYIAPKPLKIKVKDAKKIYGEPNPAFSVSYEGFAYEEDSRDLAGELGFSCNADKTSDVGEYIVSAGGLKNENYNITFEDGKLIVNKAELTAEYAGEEILFGDEPELAVHVSGFVNGDTAETADDYVKPTFQKPIPADVTLTGHVISPVNGSAKNYYFNYIAGVLKIRYREPIEESYNLSVPKGLDNWYSEDIIITANEDYTLSYSLTGPFGKTLTLSDEGMAESDIIYLKDSDGRMYQTRLKYKLDKTLPVVEGITGIPEAWTNKNTVIIIKVADALSGINSVDVYMGSTHYFVAKTDMEYSFSADQNGVYVIKVTDKAGNVTTETVEIARIDKVAPVVNWDSKTIKLLISDEKWFGAVALSATADYAPENDEINTLMIKMKNNDTAYEETNSQELNENGTYVVSAIGVDEAGNESEISITINIDINIDKFKNKVNGLNSSSLISQVLDVQKWYNSLTDNEKLHIEKSTFGVMAKQNLQELWQGKSGELKQMIKDVSASSSLEKITDLKTAFEALPQEAKNQITDIDGEYKYKTTYDNLVADSNVVNQLISLMTANKPDNYAELFELIHSSEELTNEQSSLIPEEYRTRLEELKSVYNTVENFTEFVQSIINTYNSETIGEIIEAENKYSSLEEMVKAFIQEDIKAKYNTLVVIKERVKKVTDKIDAIPGTHIPGNQCESYGNDFETHKKSIEEAKIAYEMLTQYERKLIKEEKKNFLETQYSSLIFYLGYISRVGNIEVVGLAEKVDISAVTPGAGNKVIIALNVKQEQPKVAVEPQKSDLSQFASYDIKLMVTVMDLNEQQIGERLQIQPKSGEKVVIKIKLPDRVDTTDFEIWHVKGDTNKKQINDFEIINSSDGKYVIFEVDSFSHFVLFAKSINNEEHSEDYTDTYYSITVQNTQRGSISPESIILKQNSHKTFTITPDTGYYISDVRIDGKSIGAVKTYNFENVNKNHTISAEFSKIYGNTKLPYYVDNGKDVMIGFACVTDGKMKYIVPTGKAVRFKANTKEFADTAGMWSEKDINFVTEREIIEGTGSNIFSPDLGMTRAMFVAVIGRLYERSYGVICDNMETSEKGEISLPFCDIKKDDYTKYIIWAKENGIINGSDRNNFMPEEKITRQEIAVIIYNFAKYLKTVPLDKCAARLDYIDADAIAYWAIEEVKYCKSTSIIVGKNIKRNKNEFAPDEAAAREEIAAVLKRFIVSSLNKNQ